MDSVAYLRVSSRAEDFATQKAAIERAATARGDTIGTWYSEKRSGKLLARPELDRLRRDARAGAVRRLFVYRLDRLIRSGIRDTFGSPLYRRTALLRSVSRPDLNLYHRDAAAGHRIKFPPWALSPFRLRSAE